MQSWDFEPNLHFKCAAWMHQMSRLRFFQTIYKHISTFIISWRFIYVNMYLKTLRACLFALLILMLLSVDTSCAAKRECYFLLHRFLVCYSRWFNVNANSHRAESLVWILLLMVLISFLRWTLSFGRIVCADFLLMKWRLLHRVISLCEMFPCWLDFR